MDLWIDGYECLFCYPSPEQTASSLSWLTLSPRDNFESVFYYKNEGLFYVRSKIEHIAVIEDSLAGYIPMDFEESRGDTADRREFRSSY